MAVDRRFVRLGILAIVLIAIILVAHLTGFTASFSQARLRTLVQSAGIWGPVLFVVAFTVGELVHMPGIMFLGAAVIAFGRVRRGILCYVGSVIRSASCSWSCASSAASRCRRSSTLACAPSSPSSTSARS